MAQKASAATAIPLCHKHHIGGEHKQGFKTFWAKQKQPREFYQAKMLELFLLQVSWNAALNQKTLDEVIAWATKQQSSQD